jgi:hypothetical protein
MVLDNVDFKKWAKENEAELYENTSLSLLLTRTKPLISRLMRYGNTFHINGGTTLMRDLYQLEQDFISNMKYEDEL